MKHFFLIAGLCLAAQPVSARDNPPALPLFDWSLLFAGSWEENGNFNNRADFRLGIPRQGILLRAQALDRRALDFASCSTWDDFLERTAGGAGFGAYHQITGSRLLFGALHESGLPARARSPWSRAAPFAENRRPTAADLRATSSAAMTSEAYMRLSTPRIGLFGGGAFPAITLRPFVSAQIAAEGIARTAFAGGLETSLGRTNALIEGFFAQNDLPARGGSAWFSSQPPLPERRHSLAAASLSIRAPYFSLAGDFAMSRVFAQGDGFYGNAAVRISPPLPGTTHAGPWSLSLAAEVVAGEYVDRGGASQSEGFRAAGRIERRGGRGSLFRADASLRSSGTGEKFDRSAWHVSYRFPAPFAGGFPLSLTRVVLDAGRNASNPARASDNLDAALGFLLALPPMTLPAALLPASAARTADRPRAYPLGISLSAALRWNGSAGHSAHPYPFFPADMELASMRIGCELTWSPGIFQLRARWAYAARPGDDGALESSASVAVRFRRGRLTARMSWADFPGETSYSLSWRMEL